MLDELRSTVRSHTDKLTNLVAYERKTEMLMDWHNEHHTDLERFIETFNVEAETIPHPTTSLPPTSNVTGTKIIGMLRCCVLRLI